MSTATFISKDQNWDAESTYYWFDVDATGTEWAAYSGKYAVVDCNGDYHVEDDQGNDHTGGQFADYVLEVCEITDDIRRA